MLRQWGGTASEYCSYYAHALSDAWAHITPVHYVAVLICVSVVGWLLMKNGAR